MKIFIVEDNVTLSDMIQTFLIKENWEVYSFTKGYSALEAYFNVKPDLIILDWMLPDISGLDICKDIKSINSIIPIIMLTAKDKEEDEIKGFKYGTDDYITKPFNPNILIYRIKALLKRVNKEKIYLSKNIYINLINISVYKDEIQINLSPKEYNLLIYLYENRGHYLSRNQIITYVWGYDFQGDERTIDTHINSLRKKISKTLFKTKSKFGYSMELDYENKI